MFNLVNYAFEHNRRLSIIRNYHSYGIPGKTIKPDRCLAEIWIGPCLEGRGQKAPGRLGLDTGKGDADPELPSLRPLLSAGHRGPDAGAWFAGRGVIYAGVRLESGSGSPAKRRANVLCTEGAAPLGMPGRSRGDLLPALPAWARKVPPLCSGAGDFSLSPVLARRERLRKGALAVSQKSPARPGVEESGLLSSSSGWTAGGFSRDIPGTRPPCLRRARSLPRTAEVAREGAGAGARRCAGLSWQPRSPSGQALLSPASLQALPVAEGREDAQMAKGSYCFTAGKCERGEDLEGLRRFFLPGGIAQT